MKYYQRILSFNFNLLILEKFCQKKRWSGEPFTQKLEKEYSVANWVSFLMEKLHFFVEKSSWGKFCHILKFWAVFPAMPSDAHTSVSLSGKNSPNINLKKIMILAYTKEFFDGKIGPNLPDFEFLKIPNCLSLMIPSRKVAKNIQGFFFSPTFISIM